MKKVCEVGDHDIDTILHNIMTLIGYCNSKYFADKSFINLASRIKYSPPKILVILAMGNIPVPRLS